LKILLIYNADFVIDGSKEETLVVLMSDVKVIQRVIMERVIVGNAVRMIT
jgi:hypothetical protein